MQVPQRFLYLQENEQNFLKVLHTILHKGCQKSQKPYKSLMPKSETPKCNQHAYKQVRVTLIIRIFAFLKQIFFHIRKNMMILKEGQKWESRFFILWLVLNCPRFILKASVIVSYRQKKLKNLKNCTGCLCYYI